MVGGGRFGVVFGIVAVDLLVVVFRSRVLLRRVVRRCLGFLLAVGFYLFGGVWLFFVFVGYVVELRGCFACVGRRRSAL